MKKRLHTDAIANELKGGSAFFPDYAAGTSETQKETVADAGRQRDPSPALEISPPPGEPADTRKSSKGSAPAREENQPEQDNTELRHHDATVSRHQDAVIPRNHDTTIPLSTDGICEVVRKAVKQIGKEAATHRFTIEEKNHLAEIEYTYKRRGIKTSENEITRIAINYFVEDYRLNGELSLLAKILERLNS